jgi:hypothetical protein
VLLVGSDSCPLNRCFFGVGVGGGGGGGLFFFLLKVLVVDKRQGIFLRL